jgi:cholesterol transport system auxiliary component
MTVLPAGAGARIAGVRRGMLASLLLSCTLAIGACGGGERIRDLYFSLEAGPAAGPANSGGAIPGTLRVSTLVARGFLGGSRIVYRTAEEPLQTQRYNEYLWEEVPARAIADVMLAALRADGVFTNVITSADPARADYLLTGELGRFEHRPTDRPPRVAAEWSLALVDAKSRRLLAAKTYSGFEPTRTGPDGRTTPEAMVAAFNRLTARLVGELIRDIRGLPPELR